MVVKFQAVDLTGDVVGRLTVVERVKDSQSVRAQWLCKCECGGTKIVPSDRLRRGHTRSCGCLLSETASKHYASLGRASEKGGWSPTYVSWRSMKDRCSRSGHKDYEIYGARGITVCDRWFNSFENFLEDMGERPPGKTLDRYPDNNGNYEPGNCRWATPKEQRANQRPRKCASKQVGRSF